MHFPVTPSYLLNVSELSGQEGVSTVTLLSQNIVCVIGA